MYGITILYQFSVEFDLFIPKSVSSAYNIQYSMKHYIHYVVMEGHQVIFCFQSIVKCETLIQILFNFSSTLC